MKRNLSLKSKILVIILFQCTISVSAQQWDGAQDFIDPIFRVGQVGIGFDEDRHWNEILTLDGALVLGNAVNTEPGTIQWDNKDFLGYRGGEWVSLSAFGGQNQNHIYSLNSGNVGIGISSPSQKLDVNGGIKIGTTSFNSAGTLRWNGFEFQGGDGTNWKSLISKWNTSGNDIINNNTGNVQLGINNKLGIGRTPNSKLEIYSVDPGQNWNTGLQITSHYSGSSPELIPSDPTTYMVQRDDGFYIKSQGGYNFLSEDGNTNFIHISSGGNIGINTTSPTAKLELNGGVFVNSDVAANDMFKIAAISTESLPVIKMGIRNDAIGNLTIGRWKLPDEPGGNGYVDDRIVLDANDVSYIINTSGLAIGKTTITSGYLFDVAGKIRANEIVVNTTGADFVFEEDFILRPLSELETFIKENKHLPDIPTAKEVEENGVSLGEMQTKLLQKIEELTLYLIEQSKSIERLQKENASLKKIIMKDE